MQCRGMIALSMRVKFLGVSMENAPIPLADTDRTFFFASMTCTAGFALGVCAGIPSLRISNPVPALSQSNAVVASSYLLQAVAFIYCGAILVFWRARTTPGQPGNAFAPVLWLAGLLLVYYVLNDLVFKPSFGRPRPFVAERSIFRSLSSVGGAPSGFAARGALLTLIASLSAMRIRTDSGKKVPWYARLPVVLVVQCALNGLAAYARVLTQFHYWFDVLLGWALGVHLFWMLMLVATHALSGIPFALREETGSLLVAVIVAFSLLGFFYSGDAGHWAPVVLVCLLVAGLVNFGFLRGRMGGER